LKSNALKDGFMDSSKVQPNSAPPVALFLRYWLPVLVWMALIFSASADRQSYRHSSLFFEPLMRWLFPTMPAATVEEIHHLFRKTCHLTEYALLGGLFWRAIRRPVKQDRRPWRWDEAGLALAVVFAYAASDEFHQIFVPNRTALVSDVLIDTTGGAAGLLLLWLWQKLSKPG
jgi:VanZ family protein